MPVRGATASGVNGWASVADVVEAVEVCFEAAGCTRFSANRTLTSANSSSASVPGRMAWCSSANCAVRVRRGSTTTILPPRSRIPRSRPRMSGAVIRLPFETSGFAPRISRCRVRSRSGTGMASGSPNMVPDE